MGRYFQVFLPWDTLVPAEPTWGAFVIALLVFFSYAIVMNTVVPISLYVSVEVSTIRMGVAGGAPVSNILSIILHVDVRLLEEQVPKHC